MVVIPIFVSSTFRDFHGERDAMRRIVAPALDAAVAPYAARVELIDLRWGIDTTDAASDEAAQQEVLDVCLGEIERSRPLFVGLVGDRFGWVPPEGRLLAAAARAGVAGGLPQSERELSVTALEFWHGALDGPRQSVFAIRDLVGDVPLSWRDDIQTNSVWLRSEVEQAARATPEQVVAVRYQADVADGRLTSNTIETFANKMVELLIPIVVERAHSLTSGQRSAYDVAAELSTENRRQVIVGREALVTSVHEEFQDSANGSYGVVLDGPSGVGKTSTWIAVCELLERSGWNVARIIVGAGPGSTSTREVIALLADQLGLSSHHESPADDDAEQGIDLTGNDTELLAWWVDAIAKLPPTTVVAIDGLDRLDRGGSRERLDILRLPTVAFGASFLVTTTSSGHVETLTRRGLHSVAVGPLDPDSVRAAAAAWADVDGHHQLPVTVLDVLASSPRSGQWVRLAVNELMWLEQSDFERAEAASAAGMDAGLAIAEMLRSAAATLPDRDEALAERTLRRAATEVGHTEAADTLLGALAVTRSGLAPVDLAAISGIEPLKLARALRLLGAQVSVRDVSGRLAIDHETVRRAAVAGFVVDAPTIHAQVAEHLESVTRSVETLIFDEAALYDLTWHSLLGVRPDLLASAVTRLGVLPAIEREGLARLMASAIMATRTSGQQALHCLDGLPAQLGPNSVGILEDLAALARLSSAAGLYMPECLRICNTLLSSLASVANTAPDAISAATQADSLLACAEVFLDCVGGEDTAIQLLQQAQAHGRQVPCWQEEPQALLRLVRSNVLLARVGATRARAADSQALVKEVLLEEIAGTAVDYVGSPNVTYLSEAMHWCRGIMRRDPGNVQATVWLCECLLTYSEVSFRGREESSAEALRLTEQLLVREPNNPEWIALRIRAQRAFLSARIDGEGLFGNKSMLKEARQRMRSAKDAAERLAIQNPDRTDYASLLAQSLKDIAELEREVSSWTESTAWSDPSGFPSVRPLYLTARTCVGRDPLRASANRAANDLTVGYSDECRRNGRHWRAFALELTSAKYGTRYLGAGPARRIPIWIGSCGRQFRRVLDWASIRSWAYGLTQVVPALFAPKTIYIRGRQGRAELVYRDYAGEVHDEPLDMGARFEGISTYRSVAWRMFGQWCVQLLAVLVLVGALSMWVSSLIARGAWLQAALIGVIGLVQQFSMSAYWDQTAIGGRPTEEAARAVDAFTRGDGSLITTATPAASGHTDTSTATGNVRWHKKVGTTNIYGLAYSPDGQRVYSVNASGLLVALKANDGATIFSVEDAPGKANRVCTNPDGTRLVVGCEDGTIRVSDAQSGSLLQTLTGHERGVLGVDCSPNGTRICSTSRDSTLRIWELDTGQCETVLRGHTNTVDSCAYHPDGSQLASSSWDGTVVVWDLATGRPRLSLAAPRALGYPRRSFRCMFTADGQYLVALGAGGRMRIWSADEGKALHTLKSGFISTLAASPSGALVATASVVKQKGEMKLDSRVDIWDVAAGTRVASVALIGKPTALVWHPTRPILACGVSYEGLHGQFVVAIDFPGLARF